MFLIFYFSNCECFNLTDIANYYEDGSAYDYENYEDLPIRPESPTDQKSSPTKSSDPATSAQLGAPGDATPVPDLKTVVSVEVMNTSVQAMVIWTQPMDIRPTSYKVQWNRVTCQVDESVLPPCGLRSQQYDTSIKATVEKVCVAYILLLFVVVLLQLLHLLRFLFLLLFFFFNFFIFFVFSLYFCSSSSTSCNSCNSSSSSFFYFFFFLLFLI